MRSTICATVVFSLRENAKSKGRALRPASILIRIWDWPECASTQMCRSHPTLPQRQIVWKHYCFNTIIFEISRSVPGIASPTSLLLLGSRKQRIVFVKLWASPSNAGKAKHPQKSKASSGFLPPKLRVLNESVNICTSRLLKKYRFTNHVSCRR